MQRIRIDKLHHMGMVAEYMRVRAKDYGLDPEIAYVIGLLHDVGYIVGRKNHATVGADLLNNMNIPFCYTEAVRLHGVSPYRLFEPTGIPVEILRDREAVAFEDIAPEVRNNRMLTLLLEADMRVDKNGNLVGFDKRKADLFYRYSDHDIQKNITETIQYVFEWCERTGVTKPPRVADIIKKIQEG